MQTICPHITIRCPRDDGARECSNQTAHAVVPESLAAREPVVQGISGAAYRADRIDLMTADQGAAQPADVNVDRPLVDVGFTTPHPVQDLFTREHPAGT